RKPAKSRLPPSPRCTSAWASAGRSSDSPAPLIPSRTLAGTPGRIGVRPRHGRVTILPREGHDSWLEQAELGRTVDGSSRFELRFVNVSRRVLPPASPRRVRPKEAMLTADGP